MAKPGSQELNVLVFSLEFEKSFQTSAFIHSLFRWAMNKV
jgi:hypothetical protein